MENMYPSATSPVTLSLAASPLFQRANPILSLDERTELTYQRARAIAKAYGMVVRCRIVPQAVDSIASVSLDTPRCGVPSTKVLAATY